MRVITEKNITEHEKYRCIYALFLVLKVHELKSQKSITKNGEVVCAWSTSDDILFNFFIATLTSKDYEKKNVYFYKCTKYIRVRPCTREK